MTHKPSDSNSFVLRLFVPRKMHSQKIGIIPLNDISILNIQESMIEIPLTEYEPQVLIDKYSKSTKILDAAYRIAVMINNTS
jgi:hypothetical protein